ncbi:MAG: hypothetical protein EBS53_15170 [Bacteroidetes bacterium]|nr:hypothetical protein [Bacteroidota bacterium]
MDNFDEIDLNDLLVCVQDRIARLKIRAYDEKLWGLDPYNNIDSDIVKNRKLEAKILKMLEGV